MQRKEYRDRVLHQVAQIVRQRREEKGLSQTELAARSGLSQPMIGFIEQQQRNPTLDALLRVAEALNISVSEIVLEAEKRSRED